MLRPDPPTPRPACSPPRASCSAFPTIFATPLCMYLCVCVCVCVCVYLWPGVPHVQALVGRLQALLEQGAAGGGGGGGGGGAGEEAGVAGEAGGRVVLLAARGVAAMAEPVAALEGQQVRAGRGAGAGQWDIWC